MQGFCIQITTWFTTRECKGSDVLCNDSLNHQTSAYQVSTCKLIFVLLKVKLQSYGLNSELSLVKHEEICRHEDHMMIIIHKLAHNWTLVLENWRWLHHKTFLLLNSLHHTLTVTLSIKFLNQKISPVFFTHIVV